jgi:hypothetical protein
MFTTYQRYMSHSWNIFQPHVWQHRINCGIIKHTLYTTPGQENHFPATAWIPVASATEDYNFTFVYTMSYNWFN